MLNYNLLLIILLAAASLDLLLPLVFGFGYRGYNHLKDTISELGTAKSPVRVYECLNLMLVGILFLVYAAGIHTIFETKEWHDSMYTVGILIFGAGCILAGIFPEDTRGSSETVSGKIHGIASGIGFLFLMLNPLWAVWMKGAEGIRTYNVLLFAGAVLTFSMFIMSEKRDTGLLRFTGLFQRLNLIVLYGCLVMNHVVMVN